MAFTRGKYLEAVDNFIKGAGGMSVEKDWKMSVLQGAITWQGGRQCRVETGGAEEKDNYQTPA
jgi:hypothetical protein